VSPDVSWVAEVLVMCRTYHARWPLAAVLPSMSLATEEELQRSMVR
jgi:hypothetical protein